ncbi:cation diffusion facilitator family transporter [Sporolactobacillus pectinivorans]|uniref:cation diffusion facilitator family transporter n=1 Tax=Sporolactobacillus pectinivorans TaxID=1591408 RepID=UPI003B84823C
MESTDFSKSIKSLKKDDHAHGHSANRNALLVSFLMITGFMVVEFIGGLFSHSLALLSDAGHMLSDSISLGLSFTALLVGAKVAANNKKTFGYRRFEILSALFNGVLLLAISSWIVVEAVLRFSRPVEVASTEMLIIAVIGLFVNLAVAGILMKGEAKENLNVHSAFIHVIGDLLGSVGAIAAAVVIALTGWQLADPIASIIVSLIILKSGWQVARESVNILMESKPDNLNLDEIRLAVSGIDGVASLHDLHVWTITSGFLSLSCHLKVTEGADRDEVLRNVERILGNYNLEHSTIQIEGINYADCHSDCAHHIKNN